MFGESKMIGFKNETTDIQDELLFNFFLDVENLEVDYQNIVKAGIKDENLSDTLVKIEKLESE